MDPIQGALALVNAWLGAHLGAFDEPLCLIRTRSIHAHFHATKRIGSKYIRLAPLVRSVHPMKSSDCSGTDRHINQRNHPGNGPTFETKYSLAFRWTRELLPFAASDGMFLSQHVTTDSFLKHFFTFRSQSVAEEDSQNYRVKFLPLHTWFYRLRYVRYQLKRLSRRAAPHAVSTDSQLAIDNIPSKWVVRPHDHRTAMLLLIRRSAYSWPAFVAKYSQAVLSLVISSFDTLVGELGSLLLLSAMEYSHPLKLRRDNAQSLLLTNCAVVKDLEGLRETLQNVGLDSFMVLSAHAVLLKYLFTVFQGRRDMLSKAITMIRVGQLWRAKPPMYMQNYLSRFQQLFLSEFELPVFDADEVDAMALMSYDSQSSENIGSSMGQNDSMILLSRSISNLANLRLQQTAENTSRDGALIFSTLLNKSSEVETMRKEVIQSYCMGWSIGLSQSNLYNAFDFENCFDDEMRSRLVEMLRVCIDCHAAMLCSALNGHSWFDTSLSQNSEYKGNIRDLRADMKKVEQLDVLVALHRNEIRAAAWLFVDEIAQDEWLNWQKWCIADALELTDLVFRQDDG
ncbi:hypothetical protein FGB62_49g218 [Gracilaria domingensis]|nr:hypothetical protein FGB62_49g218 [Gracilaria domingensis]